MENFETFAENIKERILDFMPEEYRTASVRLEHVLKNNDEKKTGISIWKEGQTGAPVLYLEEYYQMLREGKDETGLLWRIARKYLDYDRMVPQNNKSLLPDFETAKEHLWVQIAGKESNQKRLEGCVYKEVEGTDLVATFRLSVEASRLDWGSVLVDRGMLEKWGCDINTLYEAALENTVQKLPLQLMRMESALSGKPENLKPEEVSCELGELYVLENAGMKYGAVAMLYPGVLQALAENNGSGLFILPSSVDEVLVMKADGAEAKELQRMVMDINRSEVKRGDILSDQVYRYDAKTQSLSCATTQEETKELLEEFSGWGMHGQPMAQEQLDEEMER